MSLPMASFSRPIVCEDILLLFVPLLDWSAEPEQQQKQEYEHELEMKYVVVFLTSRVSLRC